MSPIPSSIIDNGDDPDDRLRELGLPESEDLRTSVHVGCTHAASCTDHDPRSLPGTLTWGKGIGELRDLLIPKGWLADSDHNYETVVDPTGQHQITLAAGTPDTGRRNATPRTKNPKGPATNRAVDINAQLPLWGTAAAGSDGTAAPRVTWILLYFFDRYAGQIRLELSRPAEMSGKHITSWSERILLPPIEFSEDVNIDIDDGEDDGDDGSIDIPVPRKSD